MTACALCQSTDVRTIARRGRLVIRQCGACGRVEGHQAADAPRAVVPTAPGHFARLKEQDAAFQTILAGMLARRAAVYAADYGARPKHWLEIGPGSGALQVAVESAGGGYVGVEYDSEMAAFCLSLNRNVVHGDFAALDIAAFLAEHAPAQGAFDIVYFSQVFEHVAAPRPYLDNVFAALRPGGLVHLDVPNHDGLTALLRKLNPRARGYGEITPPAHMIAYGARPLEHALRQAGFERIRIFSCRYDDPVFGVAHANMLRAPMLRALWTASGLLGMSGNLVALARKPERMR